MAPYIRRRGRARGISSGRGASTARPASADLRAVRSTRLQPNEPLHMTTRRAAASATGSVASAGSSQSSVGETSRSIGGDDIDTDRPAKVARVSPRQQNSMPQPTPPPQDSGRDLDPEDEDMPEEEFIRTEANSNEETADYPFDETENGAFYGEGDEEGDELGDEEGVEEDEEGDEMGDEMGDDMGDEMGDEIGDEEGDDEEEDDEIGEEIGDEEGDEEEEDEEVGDEEEEDEGEGQDDDDSHYDLVKESVEPRLNGHIKLTRSARGGLLGSTRSRLSKSPSRTLDHSVKTRSADRQSAEVDEAGGLLKRLPGRRRAPHPDINIEVDLRRQLELKVAYRAVVKALKPILTELAERTKKELESNKETYKQFEEFDEVTAELDVRLRQRMSLLKAELQEEEARLEREKNARKELVQENFQYAIRDRRDDYLLKCQNKFMTILRSAEKEDDSDATDYEDGIVPNLYHINSDGSRTRIPDGYDSRSRYFVETEHVWEGRVVRTNFRKEQENFEASSLVSKPKDFAVYDPEQRAVGVAHYNLRQLGKATDHVAQNAERSTKKISNAAATRLHTLADATTMMGPLIKQDPKLWADMSAAQGPNMYPNHHPGASNGSMAGPKMEPGTPGSKPRTTRRRRQDSRSQDPYIPLSSNSGGYPNMPGPSGHQPNANTPYGHPPPPLVTAAPANQLPPANSPRTQPYFPFGSYPSQQKLDYSPGRETADPILNLPPRTQDGERLQPKPMTPTAYDPPRAHRRRRPGPRAFYAGEEAPQSGHGPSQHVWEPFTNTMGPPTYLPNYVKGSDIARQTSSASTSPITPVNTLPSAPRGGADWPGFSNNAAVGAPSQAAGFESRNSQGSSFPSMSSAFPTSSGAPLRRPTPGNEKPTAQSPNQRWRRESSPGPGQTDSRGIQPPPSGQSHHQQPPPMFPSPHHYSGYYQPNNMYGPFQQSQQQQPQQQQPQQGVSRPQFQPPATTSAPLLPHPFYFQNPQASPTRSAVEHSPRQVSNAASPPASDPAKQQSWQSGHYHSRSQSQPHTPSAFTPLAPRTPLPPPRQEPIQHFSGQSGHQRILPATLDPSRRSAGPPGSASGTPIDGHSSTPAPTLSQGQQHGLYPAFSTAPQAGHPRQASPPEQSQQPPKSPAVNKGSPPARIEQYQQPHQQRPPQYGWHHYANILPAPHNESAVSRRDREAELQERERERERKEKEKEWKFTRSRWG